MERERLDAERVARQEAERKAAQRDAEEAKQLEQDKLDRAEREAKREKLEAERQTVARNTKAKDLTTKALKTSKDFLSEPASLNNNAYGGSTDEGQKPPRVKAPKVDSDGFLQEEGTNPTPQGDKNGNGPSGAPPGVVTRGGAPGRDVVDDMSPKEMNEEINKYVYRQTDKQAGQDIEAEHFFLGPFLETGAFGAALKTMGPIIELLPYLTSDSIQTPVPATKHPSITWPADREEIRGSH